MGICRLTISLSLAVWRLWRISGQIGSSSYETRNSSQGWPTSFTWQQSQKPPQLKIVKLSVTAHVVWMPPNRWQHRCPVHGAWHNSSWAIRISMLLIANGFKQLALPQRYVILSFPIHRFGHHLSAFFAVPVVVVVVQRIEGKALWWCRLEADRLHKLFIKNSWEMFVRQVTRSSR